MAARTAQDRDRIDRAIHHASWLGAFAMFAYGAALSFDVLHSIALAAGLSPVLAWLWPLGFETFMAVAAVAVLAEQRTRPGKVPWYPWVLTALAAGSSIALNFGHPYIPLDHHRGCWSLSCTACRRSVRRLPGTCSYCAWPTAATKTAASTPSTPARTLPSWPIGKTSRTRRRPSAQQPPPATGKTVRTESRPARWCGSCSPARPRTGRCPGRT
jgi:hypothetical protein